MRGHRPSRNVQRQAKQLCFIYKTQKCWTSTNEWKKWGASVFFQLPDARHFLKSIHQQLNHHLFRFKIDNFSQKGNKNELKSQNFPSLRHFWKKNNNETKCFGVKWTWGALVDGRAPIAWSGLWTTWGLLPPSPLPTQHPHKTIICLQTKILADVRHKDVLRNVLLDDLLPSYPGCSCGVTLCNGTQTQ